MILHALSSQIKCNFFCVSDTQDSVSKALFLPGFMKDMNEREAF